jgi:hypothetical protein
MLLALIPTLWRLSRAHKPVVQLPTGQPAPPTALCPKPPKFRTGPPQV